MTEIVFVGAAGRSGTTFLAHQLARFSGIYAPGESQWIAELIEREIPQHEYVNFARNHWKVVKAPVAISERDWADLEIVAREQSLADFVTRLMSQLAGGSGVIVDHTPWNLARRRALLSVFP